MIRQRERSTQTIKACIYCRISDDREDRAVGVGTQEADCRALAERRGWEVVAVFVDNSKTAWKRDRKRPGWDQLIAGVAARDYDAIIVWHGDRLMRQPRDLEDLLDIADQGTLLASPTSERDLSDPDDQYILRIDVAHACRSSDDTSRRTKRSHLRAAQEGRPVGGTRPFGYNADKITVNDDEAALIRQAATEVIAGRPIRSIAKRWADAGVTMPRGGRPSQTALKRILTSPRLIGRRTLDGVDMAAAVWPAILDEPTWHRVGAELRSRRPAIAGGYGPRRYLLTGLLRCGKCDTKLIARPQSNRRRTYVCTSNPDKGGCGGIRIVAEPLEAWVAAVAFDAVDHGELAARQTAMRDDSALVDLVHTLDAKLLELADDWANDRITRPVWETARAGVETRLDEARAQLARRVRPVILPDRTAWDTWDFDQKRAALEEAIDHVAVGPATPGHNRFDTERVTIRWTA